MEWKSWKTDSAYDQQRHHASSDGVKIGAVIRRRKIQLRSWQGLLAAIRIKLALRPDEEKARVNCYATCCEDVVGDGGDRDCFVLTWISLSCA